MKTIGLIPSQRIVSLAQSEDGGWLNVPEGETVVPLVKLPQPALTAGQKAEPVLNWFADRVERGWTISQKSQAEIIAERKRLYPDAEMYQIHDWMHDAGLDPDAVPQIISAAFPAGVERKKALSRWNKAVRVPRDHPLVNLIGSMMTPPLTPSDIDAAWQAILAR